MSEEILIVRISTETKKALKDRAFDLRLTGGMSELVMSLINKELGITEQPTPAAIPTTEAN